MKFLRFSLAAVALAALCACSLINKGASELGLGVQFEDVYEQASTFEERVYLTAGLVEATIEVATSQCMTAGDDAGLQAACERAADAADRLAPLVAGMLDSLALYIEAKADVDAAVARDGKAPQALINAASAALTRVALEYAGIRKDLEAFINGPG